MHLHNHLQTLVRQVLVVEGLALGEHLRQQPLRLLLRLLPLRLQLRLGRLPKAVMLQHQRLGQSHLHFGLLEFGLVVLVASRLDPLEHSAVPPERVVGMLVDLGGHMVLGALRVAGGLPQCAEGLQLLPSALRLLQPLVSLVPLAHEALPAEPAFRTGPPVVVQRGELDVEDHAAGGPVLLDRLRLQEQVAQAADSNALGDRLDRLLLALAHADADGRRVLRLDGDQAVARHDGDPLPAARDAREAFAHPPAYAPMHEHVVKLIGPLLTARSVHVQQLGEVLLQVNRVLDTQQLHLPDPRVGRVEALGVKVYGFPRNLEFGALANVE
mmetsp:Transcript_112795/g.306248  ORF Transcript_112795/g.306248 Transcript_112795/m.306248 type:complete len:327 (-) Transcript_112795:829-1809(-)